MLGYIEDGCTLDGYVEADPGIHDAVSFEYRPLTQLETSKLVSKMKSLSGDIAAAEHAMAAVLERAIIQWSVTNRRGRIVEPSKDNILRLTTNLHYKLRLVVTGERASDTKPDEDDELPPELENSDPAGDIFGDEDAKKKEAGEEPVSLVE